VFDLDTLEKRRKYLTKGVDGFLVKTAMGLR
jgi:hypothetical protein